MDHFITGIKIEKLRHLSGIDIKLNPEYRQHLILTGKNGSGKTSLLMALQKYLRAVNRNELTKLYSIYIPQKLQAKRDAERAQIPAEKRRAEDAYKVWSAKVSEYKNGVDVEFSAQEDIEDLYQKGEFITAFFPANRKAEIVRAHGVEDIKLNDFYAIDTDPGKLLQKYMVHLKTQQAYAKNENENEVADKIQQWFDRFVEALRILLDDESIKLEYDYKDYNFKIHEAGREPFGFDALSDGYSSVIHIVSDLILRMDHNWLLKGELSEYNVEGIVLIDELETHLHIELQKKIMPFLTKFFPGIQFIVTTHSPYILNSISNVKIYDLERCIEMENLCAYTSDSLAEGYFGADEYSDELKRKLERYQFLKEKNALTEKEKAECAELQIELKNIPKTLSPEAWERFAEIEGEPW